MRAHWLEFRKNMKSVCRKLAIAVVLLMGFAVSACDPVTLGGLEAATLMGSEKTVVDHMVSMASGKDCSTIRKERGLTYCVEDMPQVRQNIYCYRDLGGVTCYDRADPHSNGQQRVDRNDHNLPK